MIVELGHFVLILAFSVAIAQASVPLWALYTQKSYGFELAKSAAQLQLLLLAAAFAALTSAFLRSDFSLQIVFANSHEAKPLVYKLAGVWGNHEGSMLLWILILAAYGAVFAVRAKPLPARFATLVLVVQGWLGAAFLAFLIFTSNPFARLFPTPFSGRGLTPILQDPALAAHPPLLYAGYVGFSISFAFAIAVLVNKEQGRDWARWMRPWILTAWIFLTLGIALGSFWAYYELGWGGFWFWDPVENASLMPWLSGTALLHSALVAERSDSLKRWTLLLAILTFSLSLAGTFLVRSGVLTSVHAFANDPERGVFILAILTFFTVGGLALYARYLPSLAADKAFAPVSREGLLLANNILLAAATMTVFVGTIYPLVLDALGMGKISVGAPYFNAVFAPLTLPFLLLLPLGPLLTWQAGRLIAPINALGIAAIASVLLVLGLWLTQSGVPLIALLLIGASLWLALGAMMDLLLRLRPYGFNAWVRPWRLPAAAFSAPLAHAGLAVMIVGIISASMWRGETVVALSPGDRLEISGAKLSFDGVRDIEGPNYQAEQAQLSYLNGPHKGETLTPERRFYQAERGQTTEAAITTDIRGHLYAVLGEPVGNKRVLRVWYHPLVALIWIGALLMALGGSFALGSRLSQARRVSK
ncbi:heme lyase CcmF/NrfE family subunit [Alphaproteobacteria bacterium]|nr:heme lyase CcmF/NrfE family subunit [Alphaproteobacteria bacterium]